MPRIINAYDGNSAIGDSLAKLGESIYGDQAKNEVYRQKAFGSKRENDNIPLLADAVARGDRDAIARFGVMSNKTGQDTGDFNRLGVSNHASGVDDPRLAIATMGAGGAFTSTAPGQGRALANDRFTNAATNASSERNNERTNRETHYATDENNASQERRNAATNTTSVTVGAGNNQASRDVAGIQADKQAASDKYKFDNTYETTYDPESGRTVLTPRSQAAGREVAPTPDSVIGNVMRKQADRAAPQNGAPVADPLGGLDPRILKKTGLDLPQQSMVHPGNGATGISRDGGRTVILPNGSTVPATGFQPVDQGTALAEARGGIQRAQTAQPLVVGDPAKGQAAADAANTSGLGSFLQKHANAEIGAIPGASTVLQAATGSPEIAPGTQRAQSQQDVRNNAARTVLLGGPGRQTVQAQKWINDLLPQGSAFANPATEAAKIPTIVNELKTDHEQYRQIVQTTSDPAERTKALLQMRQIENMIRMYTEQAPGPQASAPTAGAPQQAATAAPPAPKIGELRDGYTFQGDDPASPASWMKAQ